jgi:pimeloyl-ACP methyl ester carboxylesterase
MLFLHGIFGSGANWRAFARRWVESNPAWGAVLVDLRQHGLSQGFPGPHTVQAAAEDLLGLEGVEGALGHSFGGKVALAYVAARRGDLEVAHILDVMPGVRTTGRGSESTLQVMTLLESSPPVLPTREALVDRVVEAGLGRDLGQWLAMNLVREPDGTYRLRLEVPTLRALLEDHLRLDLWPVVEAPPGRVQLRFVLGGKSTQFNEAERARLEAVCARLPDRVHMDVLPGAGHWVHVDDPEGLFRVVSSWRGS